MNNWKNIIEKPIMSARWATVWEKSWKMCLHHRGCSRSIRDDAIGSTETTNPNRR